MKKKSFEELISKIYDFDFEESFDIIVGISRGGIIPSGMIAQIMNIPVKIININYRDDNHSPRYEMPKLVEEIDFNYGNKNILLVDDVSRSGKTLSFVKELLIEADLIKTFVINGSADYSLYNEDCFKMPWLK
jgi:xanthine phosphoribosyltransferase